MKEYYTDYPLLENPTLHKKKNDKKNKDEITFVC